MYVNNRKRGGFSLARASKNSRWDHGTCFEYRHLTWTPNMYSVLKRPWPNAMFAEGNLYQMQLLY